MATQTTQTGQTMIDSTLASTSPRTAGAQFTAQLAALFLMATGWGWIAGNFVQPANTTWGAIADTIHVIPLAILLPLGLWYVGAAAVGTLARGARNGITAMVAYGLIGVSVMIVLGLTNPDPNSVGVHTFEDWMPTIVLIAGALLWLTTLVTARRAHA
jgi:hypothetical protein